jgi:GNAT superfamily N-acetyltransferase
MYYRKHSGEPFGGQINRRALRSLVDAGTTPGLLAYADGIPIGWISLGPRQQYPRLNGSPVMRPVDDRPVWSIVCFFVDPDHRGTGVTRSLLKAAIDFSRSRGAQMLEAYPVDAAEPTYPDWFGGKAIFDREGFTEVARRRSNRPVVRRRLRPRRRRSPS